MAKKPVKWVRTRAGYWDSEIGDVYLVSGTEEDGVWEGTVKGAKIMYIPPAKPGKQSRSCTSPWRSMAADSARSVSPT
jgi:hypothetical protein